MKSILLFLLIIYLSTSVFAQQAQKADDALLLEYYQNQRFADAADYLKKTYPEPVTDVKILSGLAYTSEMAARLPEAEDYYQRIYATDTTNMAVLFNLGSINARRGNNTKAINYYKKILAKDSTNFNVLKQMATLSRASGSVLDAINYLIKANKLNPTEPDVAYDLSSFFINLKLYKKADTVVTAPSFKKPIPQICCYCLEKRRLNTWLEKFPETVVVCNQLVQTGNQTDEIVNMLGNSWYNLKKYSDDCITTLKKLEESNTASETSYYYMAMSYKALHNHALAVIYFDKAVKAAVSENVNSYYGEMADSYDQLHQLKKAVNAYQKSLLYGVMPLTYYALANLYDTELKNKALALRYYRKYINSDPPKVQQSYTAYAKRRVGELAR